LRTLRKKQKEYEKKSRNGGGVADRLCVSFASLISVAQKVFDEHMPGPNQLSKKPSVNVTASDLLGGHKAPAGTITIAGVNGNIDVGLEYLESWLRGVGCVPLHNLMEDAATAEIARCQIWQWIKHRAKTEEGQVITKEWIAKLLKEHVAEIQKTLGEKVRTQ
jgi:malate synthase